MRRLSGSARVVLVASLVLLMGAALFPRVGADESDAVSAATATVTFVGGDRAVPVVVDAWVDPAEVPDAGSVNVAWTITLPSADELLVDEGLVWSRSPFRRRRSSPRPTWPRSAASTARGGRSRTGT